MNKTDFRSLPPAAQEEKRKLAIKLWKTGMLQKDVAVIVEVSRQTMSEWVRRYKDGGTDALKAQTRGYPTGTNRNLTADQEAHLKNLIKDKYPDQLKMDYVLWTRKAVMELIKQETGLDMPVRTVGEYLKRWKFTPQKPTKRAYEQNPKAVKRWLKEEYPQIEKRAKDEGAEIFWGDETGVRNNGQRERGFAPKGKTPVVRLSAKRQSINMISAITNQGTVRFKIYDGTMDASVLKDFCRRLIQGSKKKVFLILDNLRVHHAKVFKAWLSQNEEEIEVFYLPSYSPELNPDEYLNCDLKKGVHSGKPARTKESLKKKVRSHMKLLQNRPERVASYFNHPDIKYAA